MKMLGVLALLLCPLGLRAQSSFTIPVQNTSGQAITGATVTLSCQSGGCGTSIYTATSSNGNAVFSNVIVGRYTVTTSGPGIASYSYTYDVSSPNPSSLNNIIFVDGVTYPKTGAGILAAAAQVCSSTKSGRVILPSGTYLISSPGLNLTGLRGCTFEGDAFYSDVPGANVRYGTVLTFNYTGANTVGIDISDSDDLTFRNILFSCGTSAGTAPTVCFLHGRATGSHGILNNLDHCWVFGYSPWIYYNYRGEQFTAKDSLFEEIGASGVPITISEVNTAGVTSPNVTLGGGASTSIIRFSGNSSILSQATSGSPNALVYLDEGSDKIQSVYIDGYMQGAGSNNFLIKDTTGATGHLYEIQTNIQVDEASASNNSMVSIAGEADNWNLNGHVNPFNNSGGPALSFGTISSTTMNFLTNEGNSFSASSLLNVSVSTDQLGTVLMTPIASYTVGNLPSAASYAGSTVNVTNSTAIATEGQTCTGGGSVRALAFSNGTVWKCF